MVAERELPAIPKVDRHPVHHSQNDGLRTRAAARTGLAPPSDGRVESHRLCDAFGHSCPAPGTARPCIASSGHRPQTDLPRVNVPRSMAASKTRARSGIRRAPGPGTQASVKLAHATGSCSLIMAFARPGVREPSRPRGALRGCSCRPSGELESPARSRTSSARAGSQPGQDRLAVHGASVGWHQRRTSRRFRIAGLVPTGASGAQSVREPEGRKAPWRRIEVIAGLTHQGGFGVANRRAPVSPSDVPLTREPTMPSVAGAWSRLSTHRCARERLPASWLRQMCRSQLTMRIPALNARAVADRRMR